MKQRWKQFSAAKKYNPQVRVSYTQLLDLKADALSNEVHTRACLFRTVFYVILAHLPIFSECPPNKHTVNTLLSVYCTSGQFSLCSGGGSVYDLVSGPSKLERHASREYLHLLLSSWLQKAIFGVFGCSCCWFSFQQQFSLLLQLFPLLCYSFLLSTKQASFILITIYQPGLCFIKSWVCRLRIVLRTVLGIYLGSISHLSATLHKKIRNSFVNKHGESFFGYNENLLSVEVSVVKLLKEHQHVLKSIFLFSGS